MTPRTIEQLRRTHGPQGSDRYTGYKIPDIEVALRHLLINHGMRCEDEMQDLLREHAVYSETVSEIEDQNRYSDSKPTFQRGQEIAKGYLNSRGQYDFANIYITEDGPPVEKGDIRVVDLESDLNARICDMRQRDDGSSIIFTAGPSLLESGSRSAVSITNSQTQSDLSFSLPETFLCTVKYRSGTGTAVKSVKPFVPCGEHDTGITCSCPANIYQNVLSNSHNQKFFICKHEIALGMLLGEDAIHPNNRAVTTSEYVQYLPRLTP